MTSTYADVLVVGAGLAGLHAASLLARHGHDVLLVERRASLASGIRTTGIFVRKTLDDFPLPEQHLGPAIRRVMLYPPTLRNPVTLVSDRDEYRVGDMAPLYASAAQGAADAGVRIRDALHESSPEPLRHDDGTVLRSAFRGRLTLRFGLGQVRTAGLANAAFTLVRTPPGTAGARLILFGDRSFPSIARTPEARPSAAAPQR
jgi:flavin-dependent dehydrogenase